MDTIRDLVDVKSCDLKFLVNDEDVTFNVCILMKKPSGIHVVSVIDVIAATVASLCEISYVGESLAVVLLNYDGEEIQDYDEVMAALRGLGSYSKNPFKLDIDLKNLESPPAKPSIEEPSKLELKVVQPHLSLCGI
ncbi:hypothetical protein R3W88_008063 [Solanum pinnatisectum]|uniref:Uncharacterized protein n=1 Tax=Solanum pinnatisectum TaxID=50273 RepID=A0AAV9M8T3_9SOLN|nr:hypothetical protein R3W88_008063 [Solanum pinnatisectum]